MPSEPLKILHLEDSDLDALLIHEQIAEAMPELEILRVDSEAAFHEALEREQVRLVLSDFSLPTYDGLAALGWTQRCRPELPFIFVSGAIGEDFAVECMKIGATDYVMKSNLKRLPAAIRRALSELDTRLALLEAARVARVVPWHHHEETDTWLFGYLVKDILGHTAEAFRLEKDLLWSLVHPEDQARFASSFQMARQEDRLVFDCRIRHLDGRWLWIRWTLAWFSNECRGILQDITELHLIQDALIQSQRLESLGMMIGGLTHDFGNLLTAMSGAIELLEASPLSETQRRHVGILGRSCGRGQEIRNELLRLARKEDAPARSPLDLNELGKEAIELLRHALPSHITLDYCPCEETPWIMGVSSQLIQVLMNLGLNARDALGGMGHITVSTGRMDLLEVEAQAEHHPAGRYAFLEVGDDGPGIPSDVTAHMFEPFFTTKPKGVGTGLGLAMVRAIVQQHDGLIRLETHPGAGSRFRILLPER